MLHAIGSADQYLRIWILMNSSVGSIIPSLVLSIFSEFPKQNTFAKIANVGAC